MEMGDMTRESMDVIVIGEGTLSKSHISAESCTSQMIRAERDLKITLVLEVITPELVAFVPMRSS
jgi:hypothetical protein